VLGGGVLLLVTHRLQGHAARLPMQGAGTPPCHRTSQATIEQSLALQLLLSGYGGAVAAAGRETVYAPPLATESAVLRVMYSVQMKASVKAIERQCECRDIPEKAKFGPTSNLFFKP
jgi:hypothetical protein